MNGMLRVAVPNKGTLSEPAAEILSEAGYRRRTDPKDLTVIDPVNNVEFFFLRPKDIAIYVGSGQLDFGITGRDLAEESDAAGRSASRWASGRRCSAMRPAGRDWTADDLAGKRIATAFPNLVRKDLVRTALRPPSSGSTVPWRFRCSSGWPTPSPTWSAPVARSGCMTWWPSGNRCAIRRRC